MKIIIIIIAIIATIATGTLTWVVVAPVTPEEITKITDTFILTGVLWTFCMFGFIFNNEIKTYKE